MNQKRLKSTAHGNKMSNYILIIKITSLVWRGRKCAFIYNISFSVCSSIQSHRHLLDKENRSGVNFTNILRAAFAPIFLRQKTTNLKCKSKKAAHKIFVWKDAHKILVKLATGLLENSFPSLRSRFGLSQQVSPLQ